MSVEVEHKALSPWAPEFQHIRFRGTIVRERFVLAHEPSLESRGGIAHLALDLRPRRERCYRVNDDEIDRAAAHELAIRSSRSKEENPS